MGGLTKASGGRTAVIVAASVAAVVVAACMVWAAVNGVRQLVAFSTLTTALEDRRAAAEAVAPAVSALNEHRAAAAAQLALADQVLGLSDGIVAPDAVAAFGAAVDTLRAAEEEAGRSTSAPADPPIPGYTVAAIEAATAEVELQTAWYRQLADHATRVGDTIRDDIATVDDAATVLFASAAPFEPSLEATSWVAPVQPKLAVREALAALDGAGLDAPGVAALQAYSDAVAAMAQAHTAELATFQGDLYDNKVAALAFANSIAGGVLLEFDWVPELFGFGSGYGMAAQATLEGGDGVYYSTITLTNNLAARFGDGGPEAMIAHEVGHAITKKCWDLFQAVAGGDYEAFATAWAIGMGYTNPSNGTTAYGRPSDELVAATLSCR